MRRVIFIVLAGLVTVSNAQEKSPEQQIRETLRALPEALRSDATVFGYENGTRKVLQEGSGNIICHADDPNLSDARGAFFANCFPKSLEAYENRRAELSGNPDRHAIRLAEYESGELEKPDIAIRYTLRGHSAEAALPLSVIEVPFATAESIGLSAEPHNGRPWLMDEGELGAHIMLPGL